MLLLLLIFLEKQHVRNYQLLCNDGSYSLFWLPNDLRNVFPPIEHIVFRTGPACQDSLVNYVMMFVIKSFIIKVAIIGLCVCIAVRLSP